MKLFFWIIIFTAILFKIFTELYTDNFCAPLGSHVVENTTEETQKMAACQDNIMCKVWKIHRFNQETASWTIKMKQFECERRF